jgi:hypothetical protein
VTQHWRMRLRSLAIVVIIICAAAMSSARVPARSSRALDPGYSVALAAANRFLQAWQVQDHETAIVMLTDAARQHTSPEHLSDFFSPSPQAAYEIAHGKRLGPAQYVFPVVLFGFNGAPSRPRYCKVIVIRTGKEDWAVDRLP